MMKAKKLLAIGMAALLACSTAACAGSGNTPESEATPAQSEAADAEATDEANQETPAAATGGVLHVQLATTPGTLDPQTAVDKASFELLSTMVEGLYAVDAAGNPVLSMAKSMTKSEDGLTRVYQLRDAKWANGEPVHAKDFVFAWQRLVDPRTASEYAFMASVASISGADAIIAGEKEPKDLGVTASEDGKTLTVKLDRPVPFFESLMTLACFMPVNKDFFNEAGDDFGSSPEKMLANGAFQWTGGDAGQIECERNANYWDAKSVTLQGIQFLVLDDQEAAMQKYEKGELDVLSLFGDVAAKEKSSAEFQNAPSANLWFVTVNQYVDGLGDKNLRLALALAFDKEAIAKTILNGGSTPATFAIPKGLANGPDGKDFREAAGSDFLKSDKKAALVHYDLAKKELGKDEFTFTMTADDTGAATAVAEFIQKEIQDTLPGVTIELSTMSNESRTRRMQAHDYELSLTSWSPDYADPLTYLEMWTSRSQNNHGHWSNQKYDELILAAQKGALVNIPEERWQAMIDAEKIVMDEAPILPVCQKADAVLVAKDVKGVAFPMVGVRPVYKNAVKPK